MSQDLQNRIEFYQQAKFAYYNGEPIMTDQEFDALESELVAEGFNPTVGDSVSTYGADAKHINKMLSLKKVEADDILTTAKAIVISKRTGFPCNLSWKYDGLALNCIYKSGKLQQIITRGDGFEGKDRTEKLKHLVPNTLRQDIDVEVRCEGVIRKSVFAEKYSNYSHPRNLAAGIVSDENLDDPRKNDLVIVALFALSNEGEYVNISGERFVHAESETCYDIEDLQKFYNVDFLLRDEFDFPTDGLVASKLQSGLKLEHDGHSPNTAIAIKFPAPLIVSTVTEIKWNLKKTGKYIPQVFFEPVIVDGREIKQATGFNLEYLIKNDIKPGSKVSIRIAGDIIPNIKAYETVE